MARPRPFRFGLFDESSRSAEALRTAARKAEDRGYSTWLVRDHFIAEPFGHQLAPLTTLALVAGMTKTLRIGSFVFSNDYRHPLMLAKEIATLDVLSNGRVELGLGAGFSQTEYEQAGLPFDRPGVRIERLAEAIRILKGAFADGPFSLTGRHYSIKRYDGFPK